MAASSTPSISFLILHRGMQLSDNESIIIIEYHFSHGFVNLRGVSEAENIYFNGTSM